MMDRFPSFMTHNLRHRVHNSRRALRRPRPKNHTDGIGGNIVASSVIRVHGMSPRLPCDRRRTSRPRSQPRGGWASRHGKRPSGNLDGRRAGTPHPIRAVGVFSGDQRTVLADADVHPTAPRARRLAVGWYRSARHSWNKRQIVQHSDRERAFISRSECVGLRAALAVHRVRWTVAIYPETAATIHPPIRKRTRLEDMSAPDPVPGLSPRVVQQRRADILRRCAREEFNHVAPSSVQDARCYAMIRAIVVMRRLLRAIWSVRAIQ